MIDRRLWRRILRQVTAERQVPEEHLLLADARAWLARDEYRRCVIDAGSAAEMALSRVFDDGLSALTPKLRAGISGENRTLGRLRDVLSGVITVDQARLRALITNRNKAVHKNLSPSRADATSAIASALEVVSIVEPLAQFR